MDKNMIKIDELVRQRLSGGEEQERAGAWLQMRDLLDDKMPVRPAGGYNWRRMLTAASGLLLFASLTVGGYKMYNRFRPDDAALVAGNVGSYANSSYASHNKATSGTHGGDKTVTVASGIGSSDNTTGNPEEDASLNASVSNADVESAGTKEAEMHNNTIPGNTTKKSNSLNTYQKSTAKSTANLPDNATGVNTSSPIGASSATAAPSAASGTHTAAKGNTALNTNTGASTHHITRSASTNNNTIQPAPSYQTPSELPVADKASELSSQDIQLVKQDNTMVKNPTVFKDSIPKLAIMETVKVDPIRRTMTASRDTTDVSKMAIDRKEEKVFVSAQKVTSSKPVAAKSSVATNTALRINNAGATSRNKAKSQKSGLNMDRVNEMLAETKFRLGQVKFHSGITFGVNNYIYNTNSMMGIHIGLRGVAQLDEKWSMFAEMKYMQRFNRSYTIKDNYWRVNNIVGNEYQANEIEHFFKFSALHTIEIPIAVRYALLKQLNVFAGANLVYNFRINAEEVTRISEEQTYPGNGFNLQTKPSVSLDHFGTRFSAGYMLGLGYQISPAFDMDFRMTRNFWDNAAGSGPRKISDQLLYRPSFQLSIGYKFSRKNKVPPAK